MKGLRQVEYDVRYGGGGNWMRGINRGEKNKDERERKQ